MKNEARASVIQYGFVEASSEEVACERWRSYKMDHNALYTSEIVEYTENDRYSARELVTDGSSRYFEHNDCIDSVIEELQTDMAEYIVNKLDIIEKLEALKIPNKPS
tara:strand:- start:189 stop:509 length:321 start_codon:yes stop_codon:yes gene_type:complete